MFLVDGEQVRNLWKTDFTQSGGFHVYDFIPFGELWVEQATDEAERPYLLMHERFEACLMLNHGLTYDAAHERASAMELEARRCAGLQRNGHTNGKLSSIQQFTEKDISLYGADGRKAESLLANSKQVGISKLSELTSRALHRLLVSPMQLFTANRLFSHIELAELADTLASITATAELLGRSRIRKRQEKAEEAHAKDMPFPQEDATDFSAFDEGLHPLAPRQAVEYFRNLIPRLQIDPDRFGGLMERHAFTVAAATDQTMLEKIKDIIRERLETGQRVSAAPAEIDDVLNAAGVTPNNPSYSSMLVRTNLMDSFNSGCSRELADPDVIETFPVWEYSNPADARSRPHHANKRGNFYPSSIPFVAVRGTDIEDAANCRCVPIPVYKGDWAKLQRQGKALSQSAATFSEEELAVRLTFKRGSYVDPGSGSLIGSPTEDRQATIEIIGKTFDAVKAHDPLVTAEKFTEWTGITVPVVIEKKAETPSQSKPPKKRKWKNR